MVLICKEIYRLILYLDSQPYFGGFIKIDLLFVKVPGTIARASAWSRSGNAFGRGKYLICLQVLSGTPMGWLVANKDSKSGVDVH